MRLYVVQKQRGILKAIFVFEDTVQFATMEVDHIGVVANLQALVNTSCDMSTLPHQQFSHWKTIELNDDGILYSSGLHGGRRQLDYDSEQPRHVHRGTFRWWAERIDRDVQEELPLDAKPHVYSRMRSHAAQRYDGLFCWCHCEYRTDMRLLMLKCAISSGICSKSRGEAVRSKALAAFVSVSARFLV
jgi:hypothetical protein